MRSLGLFLGILLLSMSLLAAQGAEACGVCHSRFLTQWQSSPHSKAWTSPAFQEELGRMGAAEFCTSCHAPLSVWKDVDLRSDEPKSLTNQPVQAAPVDYQVALAEIPSARSDTLDDGVSCTSCHQVQVFSPVGKREDFVGPFHTAEGHAGREVADFKALRLCGACHGRPAAEYFPGSDVSSGYYHSGALPIRFLEGDVDCSGCHMPRASGRTVQLRTFRHLPLKEVGNHSFSVNRFTGLADALELQVSGDRLSLTNRAVGHPLRVCTDSSFEISVSASRGGKEVGRHSQGILQVGDLATGETLEVTLPFSAEAGDQVRVRLLLTEAGQEPQIALEEELKVGG